MTIVPKEKLLAVPRWSGLRPSGALAVTDESTTYSRVEGRNSQLECERSNGKWHIIVSRLD